jgi:DNA-binding MarR family transcriptional regulator
MARKLILDKFLPYRLSIASNLVSDAIAGTYESLFGLRIPEWRTIAVTAENPDGITQQQIGVKTRMDKVTVSRAAVSLVDRGLLARQRNKADGRSHHLVLTRAGRELYDAVVPKALELERRIFNRLSSQELQLFETMLHKIEEIALELHSPEGSSAGFRP